MTIAVLGAGMVGRTIALDLSRNFKVTTFDSNQTSLDALKSKEISIQTVNVDLSKYSKFAEWFSLFDLIVTAVPGFMGFKTLEAVIKAGKNVVDISFFSENALTFDKLAKERNVTVITDCGVAPGMSNLILGRYNEEMNLDSFACYVGGLPKNPQPPFFYKAPFSPVDVIQEYIRPARLMEKGKVVTKPALSDREFLHFDKAGKLEAFNTDGLRSLLETMRHIPDMKEKTLRYPGHVDLIIALQQSGFFSKTPLEMENGMITPFDFTSRLLVNEWKLNEDEEEFTVMKVIVSGEGRKVVFNLYDQFDSVTRTSSMARTTGFTCTAAVNLIAKKLFTEKGVFPPELVGKNKLCFEFVLDYLKARNVKWEKSGQ